jgi:hypothetical protein
MSGHCPSDSFSSTLICVASTSVALFFVFDLTEKMIYDANHPQRREAPGNTLAKLIFSVVETILILHPVILGSSLDPILIAALIAIVAVSFCTLAAHTAQCAQHPDPRRTDGRYGSHATPIFHTTQGEQQPSKRSAHAQGALEGGSFPSLD